MSNKAWLNIIAFNPDGLMDFERSGDLVTSAKTFPTSTCSRLIQEDRYSNEEEDDLVIWFDAQNNEDFDEDLPELVTIEYSTQYLSPTQLLDCHMHCPSSLYKNLMTPRYQ